VKVIRLRNPDPSDRNIELGREGTCVAAISPVQRGQVGDITAAISLGTWNEELARKFMAQYELIWDRDEIRGAEREERRREFAERYRKHIEAGELCFAAYDYPYIEWYSDMNGRVVLELDPSQVEVVEDGVPPPREKTPKELVEDREQRKAAMDSFMDGLKKFSEKNSKKGGYDNVFGASIR
jgi:hypothetical protein